MYIIDVEVYANYIYIVFYHILEDGVEILIIPEGPTITFLVCCVHMKLIKEVGD